MESEEKRRILKRQMRISKIREQGITLVALVVTIIIMLILAGVTLNIAISDNGIFSKAKKATKEYQIASEREYLEQNVLSVQLDKYLQNVSSEKLGKSLVDRNLENSSIWDIIVEKSENKTYGTGWNYLGKGTVLEDYGETKYNWVVNYETGEIIQLEDESYNNFDYNSTISVTDHLLFNLDSANVGLDKASWGKNATLYYYNDNEYDTVEKRKEAYEEQKGKDVSTNNGGYDRQQSDKIEEYIDEETGAFNFNGNNYIEIKSNGEYDFSEGLTFEFYGKILDNVQSILEDEEFTGLFSFWNGKYNEGSSIRFGIHYEKKDIQYNLSIEGSKDVEWGEWSIDKNAPWNQIAPVGKDLFNNDIYFVVSFDPNEGKNDKYITQKLYINDVSEVNDSLKKVSGWLTKDYYDKFIENVKKLDYLELGRSTIRDAGNWSYLKGLCYSTRIYNKALTEEEIKMNIDKTTEFHKYIIENKDEK